MIRKRFSSSTWKGSGVSSDVEKFIEELLKGSSPHKLKYSSNLNFGGHIACEYFNYLNRNKESKCVVTNMVQRQTNRLNPLLNKYDKSINPIIALTGSPGSGKTTFMVHFPEDPAYIDYVKDADLVLVSTVTFNSAMNAGEPAFGLRIIFGLLKSMGLLHNFPSLLLWLNFYLHFHTFKSLTAIESIMMINKQFMRFCPSAKIQYLLLIDELSKAQTLVTKTPVNDEDGEPFKVMTQLGSVLDNFGNVDIIVSSLTPYFLKKLLTGSQRPIGYSILKPLIGYPLGTSYYEKWVSQICSMSTIPIHNIDKTQIKILKHFYLLYSGHPRSVQRFCELISTTKYADWSKIVNNLEPNNTPIKYYGEFLKTLILTISTQYYNNYTIEYDPDDAEHINRYILSTKPISIHDINSRILIENNKLMIYNRIGNEYIYMSQTITLLRWFFQYPHIQINEDTNLASIKLQKVQLLMRKFPYLSMSEIWIYCIVISILCHSHDYESLQAIFGFMEYKGNCISEATYYPNFNVSHDKDFKIMRTNLTAPNTIRIPIPNQPGFDLRVIMNDVNGSNSHTHHLYIQCKISIPKEPIWSRIIASLVYYNVRHFLHVIKQTNLNELYIGLYMWIDLNTNTYKEEDMKASMNPQSIINELELFRIKKVEDNDERLKAMKIARINDVEINKLKQEQIDKAISFVTEYWDHIYILDKKGIQDWLLPSFLSIPELIKSLE